MATEYPVAEFPHFSDGNVKIAIGGSTYNLHYSILYRYSGFFRHLFATATELRFEVSEHDGTSISYDLILAPSLGYEHGVFQVKAVDNNIRVTMCLDSPRWSETARRYWSDIFKSFYGLEIDFGDNDIDSVPKYANELLDIAAGIQATEAVCKSIHRFIKLDQSLYASIVKCPIEWAQLALKIRSIPIMKECIIHLVGCWNVITKSEYAALSESVRYLCGKKLREVNQWKEAVECVIMKESEDKEYLENDTEMASLIYRTWFDQEMGTDGWQSPDGGAALYRMIGAGGDAYLNSDTYVSLPFIVNGSESINGLLTELKERYRPLVSNLLQNQSHYQPEEGDELPWLTCSIVDDEEFDDFDWEDESDEMDTSDHSAVSSPALRPFEFVRLESLADNAINRISDNLEALEIDDDYFNKLPRPTLQRDGVDWDLEITDSIPRRRVHFTPDRDDMERLSSTGSGQ